MSETVSTNADPESEDRQDHEGTVSKWIRRRESIEKISELISDLKPVLGEASDAVEEVYDKIDLEIDACKLALEKSDWDSRTDPHAKELITKRLSALKNLKDGYPMERVFSSFDYLCGFKNELNQILDKGW